MSEVARKILLTGVSQGLGRSLVDGFIARGHQVAGCARTEKKVQELSELYPGPNVFDVVDISSDVSVERWIAQLVPTFGVPDLIINNAAVITKNAPLWSVAVEDFEELMRINVNGTFSIIRHVMPHLIRMRSGVIANISSGWGRSVAADVAAYCASKWAIEGMTLALAEDLPQGLAAVSVNPGIINTDLLQSCFGPSADQAPTPEQWATRAVPFFLGLGIEDNGRSLSL